MEAKQRRLAEPRFGNGAGKRAEKAMGFASLAQRVLEEPADCEQLQVGGDGAGSWSGVWRHGKRSLEASSWDSSGTHVVSLQNKNPRFTGVLEADDGTRTHDLLHGKQTL